MSLNMFGKFYLVEHISGASMYGLPIGDAEPEKIGIAAESLNQFFGIDSIPPVMYEAGSLKVQSLKSFIRLIASGNMKSVDTLFVSPSKCTYRTEHWESMYRNRALMIGYNPIVERTTKFYLENYRKAFSGSDDGEPVCPMGYKRRTLAAGFRAKVQASMLITSGLDYDCTRISREDAEMISGIRDGEFTKSEVEQSDEYVRELLLYSVRNSAIQQFPDKGVIDSVCGRIYRAINGV